MGVLRNFAQKLFYDEFPAKWTNDKSDLFELQKGTNIEIFRINKGQIFAYKKFCDFYLDFLYYWDVHLLLQRPLFDIQSPQQGQVYVLFVEM